MKDISFDITRSGPPHMLSAVLGADSFFYGLFDSSMQLYSCTYHENVLYDEAFITSLAGELSKYAGIPQKVAVGTKPYLHVPLGQEDVVKYYPAFDDKYLIEEKLSSSKAVVLYGIAAKHQRVLHECMDEPAVHHLSKVFHSQAPTSTDTHLMLHIDADRVHILATSQGELILYNQFYCGAKEDYLYYAMLMYDILGLDPNKVPLRLSGRVEQESEVYDLLYGYIRVVEFVKATESNYLADDQRQPLHVYDDLYSTALCG